MADKHPWEHKQPARVSKVTKEEFESVIKKVKDREDAFKSDIFLKEESDDKPKSKPSPYRIIDGIPHKMTENGWVPLKKI